MSVKSQSKKSKSGCKVTFKLPKEVASSAKDIHLVGEFNSWDTKATPMKKQRDGSFSVTLNLEPGHEYQYRYLLDGIKWENDLNADKYVASPFGDSNSVIVI